MTYREILPAAALRPYVDRFWTRSGPEGDDGTLVLPDGCVDVLFFVDRGEAFIVGAMTKPTLVRVADRIVAVRFRPGAAASVLGIPAREVTDRRVSLDDLGPRGLRIERPAGDALGALTRAVHERLAACEGELDRKVAFAIDRLTRARPSTVRDVTAELGWTRQHLARRFAHEVGIGPRAFGRIARMQRAVSRLQADGTSSLASLASDLGYVDQAHFGRELRALAGVTPAEARRGSVRTIPSLYGETASGNSEETT